MKRMLAAIVAIGCGVLAVGCAAPNATTPGQVSHGGPSVKTVGAKISVPNLTIDKVFDEGDGKSSVTLKLAPDPFVMKTVPDASAPPGHVTVKLPVYPDAVKTGTLKHIGDMGTPMTPDLVDGAVYYRTSDSQSKVEAWYASVFGKVGYHSSGQGSSKGPGYTSTYVEYTKSGAPNIDVGFLQQGNDVAFKLKASYIVTPLRPADTYIHGDFVKAVLTQDKRTKTITDTQWITTVITQVNALRVSTMGFVSCPAITGADTNPIDMKLFDRSGRVTDVTFGVPCGVRGVQIGSDKTWLAGSAKLDAQIAKALG